MASEVSSVPLSLKKHARIARQFGDAVEVAREAQPVNEVPTTKPKHSRVKSSTTARMRKRRPLTSASATQSSDQHRSRPGGTRSSPLPTR
jgi:hypothetical protein